MIRKQRGKLSEDLRNVWIARGVRVRASAFRRYHHHEHEKYRASRARVTGHARASVSRDVASGRPGIRK
jgi:hypothetical protein